MKLPRNRVFWAVNLGHATNDSFMSMRSVLLAFISNYILPMANRQVGLAMSLVELSGALSQPVFGWLADRTGGRWLGAGGVAWTVFFILLAMMVVMLGGGFWLMVIPLTLAGLGSGAFHPVGSMYATEDRSRAATNAALFFMCGQIGLGIGPALVGLLLNNAHTNYRAWFAPVLGGTYPGLLIERGSLTPVFFLGLLAIPAVVFMATSLPSRKTHFHTQSIEEREGLRPFPTTDQSTQRIPVLPFIILIIAVSARSFANPAIITFIPLMFQAKGWSPSEYGLLASVFWVASGVTGVLFGRLGDRFDMRRLVVLSLIISAPGIFLLPDLDGALAFGVAILVGAMTGSHSLIVVLSQSLLPGRKGFASGMILGFIFATGAIGNLIVGDMIDRIGAEASFQIAGVVTFIGSFLWLALPRPKREVFVPQLADVEAVPLGAD
jgi:FSR family fosmidomycin resistance protein-like MFS transporter